MTTEPVRVLNLFTIMNRGGAETMVMNYYRNIDRSKVQYDFMVHRQERGAYDDEIEALGGRIYRMPPIRPWTAGEYRKTVRAFYAEHPEYRVIHSHMSELGYYDFREAEKAGVPVRICHAHNRPYGIDLKSPVRWHYKAMMRPHITDLFICGKESGDWLFGRKNEARFIQLNNAIDARQYAYCPEIRQKMRQSLGIGEDQLVIGHVGRFYPQKNHKFIIDIFQAVRTKNPEAVLLLVGNDAGEGGKEIHQKAEQLGLTPWASGNGRISVSVAVRGAFRRQHRGAGRRIAGADLRQRPDRVQENGSGSCPALERAAGRMGRQRSEACQNPTPQYL